MSRREPGKRSEVRGRQTKQERRRGGKRLTQEFGFYRGIIGFLYLKRLTCPRSPLTTPLPHVLIFISKVYLLLTTGEWIGRRQA